MDIEQLARMLLTISAAIALILIGIIITSYPPMNEYNNYMYYFRGVD